MKALHAALIAAGLVLGLNACAGMYGAMDTGVANVGAVKRGDNLYDVVYMGQDRKSPDFRRAMALMQSATLCKSKGFKFFKASDTQSFSNFESPEKLPVADTPQVTLQVSCFDAQDSELIQPVDTVIARIQSQYVVN